MCLVSAQTRFPQKDVVPGATRGFAFGLTFAASLAALEISQRLRSLPGPWDGWQLCWLFLLPVEPVLWVVPNDQPAFRTG